MREVFREGMHRIAPLFAGVEETMIYSCLDGEMGRAWADDPEAPACAQIITGDFCFLAGDAAVPEAPLLAGHLPEGYDRPFLLALGKEEGWNPLLEAAYGERCKPITRYAFSKDPADLDRAHLESLLRPLEGEWALAALNEGLYPAAMGEEWSRDLCVHFKDEGDYRRRGLGFAVLYKGEIVSGASSYTVYHGGIEIEIDTRPDFRRLGLATVCAARLMLECLDRGLYPSWDAANLESVALAKKLGYRYKGEYGCWIVEIDRQAALNCE